MAWNGKSFTGIRSCQSGSVCTKREELSLRFSWRSADSDRQQLSRKSGKTFCHRQEKLAIFHLAERSRRQCRSLFNHQHSTGKRHWCQRVSDKHLPHRTKMITAEIWIKHPPGDVTRLRETILRGLILFAGTRGYLGVTNNPRIFSETRVCHQSDRRLIIEMPVPFIRFC